MAKPVCNKECWKVFHHTNGNHRNDCLIGQSQTRKNILWARRQARYKKMSIESLQALDRKLVGRGENWCSEERSDVIKAWAAKFEIEMQKCVCSNLGAITNEQN